MSGEQQNNMTAKKLAPGYEVEKAAASFFGMLGKELYDFVKQTPNYKTGFVLDEYY